MKKTIAIIGGGASALVLAAMLDENIYDVTLYERKATLGRKFLVAGDGGFNLTHSEAIENLISRYAFDNFDTHFLEQSLRHFTNVATQNWFKDIGIDTYIGTSKRVFPIHGIKPVAVLNAVLNVLKNKNVRIQTNHIWQGFDGKNNLIFLQNDVEMLVKSDITVFALGGASWSKTGSDGHWTAFFKEKDICIVPFQAANCAYKIDWDSSFLHQAEGQFLKNIALSCGEMSKKGEVVVTQFGLEGGAIYALSPAIRAQLKAYKTATVYMDLKPILSQSDIKQKLSSRGHKSVTSLLKTPLHLSETAIALLKNQLTKADFTDIDQLTSKIKKLPLSIKDMAPIEEAISTVGGIALNELDGAFQFKKLPNHYAIGEMLDWDAPTGGYLLQACFSMGSYLAHHLNQNT